MTSMATRGISVTDRAPAARRSSAGSGATKALPGGGMRYVISSVSQVDKFTQITRHNLVETTLSILESSQPINQQ